MIMSDPVSILMTPKLEDVFQFKPEDPDPYFWRDLREHLQGNEEYRAEKKAFKQEHHISIEQSTMDFPKIFSETFLKDIDIFLLRYPDLSIEELTEAFCKKWRGYFMTYGEGFIRRAFLRKI